MKKPLISILISSYNKGNYLEECLKSCINQSYKNCEIILLDNYSNDKTNKILKKYSKQVKVLKKRKVSKFPSLNQRRWFGFFIWNCICCLLFNFWHSTRQACWCLVKKKLTQYWFSYLEYNDCTFRYSKIIHCSLSL